MRISANKILDWILGVLAAALLAVITWICSSTIAHGEDIKELKVQRVDDHQLLQETHDDVKELLKRK